MADKNIAKEVEQIWTTDPNILTWMDELIGKGNVKNIDDPRDQYDYRKAIKAGARPERGEDGEMHWPSKWKGLSHPNRFVKGIDTITGKPVSAANETVSEFELFLNSEPAKESFKRRLRTEEGKGKAGRPGFVYPDSKGNPTIGVGHKIIKTDKTLFQKLFGKEIDYESLISGEKALSDTQMETLLDRDVGEKLATSKGIFPSFNRFTRKMKGAILDGVYRGDLSDSPDTIELINKGFFAKASMEYLNHDEYRESKVRKTGIYKRMDRNAEIMADEENYMMRPLAKANRDENWVSKRMDRLTTKDKKKPNK